MLAQGDGKQKIPEYGVWMGPGSDPSSATCSALLLLDREELPRQSRQHRRQREEGNKQSQVCRALGSAVQKIGDKPPYARRHT